MLYICFRSGNVLEGTSELKSKYTKYTMQNKTHPKSIYSVFRNGIFILTLLTLASVPQGCISRFHQPELVSVSRFQVRNFNLKSFDLEFCTTVKNPNTYKIRILSLDAEVFLQDKAAGKIHTDTTLILSKAGVSDIKLSMETGIDKLAAQFFPVLGALQKKEQLELRLKGTVKVQARGMSKTFPFEHREKIRL